MPSWPPLVVTGADGTAPDALSITVVTG